MHSGKPRHAQPLVFDISAELSALMKEHEARADHERGATRVRVQAFRARGGKTKSGKHKPRHEYERARRFERMKERQFVAIDSEGMNYGEPFIIGHNDLGPIAGEILTGQKNVVRKHNTFLWGACADGGAPEWLGGKNKEPLHALEILDWLCELPSIFPNSIFVMFSFGYDITQIIKDMPFEKAWELLKGLPYSERDRPTGVRANRQRKVFWDEFALSWTGGKCFTVGRLKDGDNPRGEKQSLQYASKPVRIYDVFGFFQSSFVKASTGFGGSFLTENESAIITSGKMKRGDFDQVPLEEIMRYTTSELHVLSRMMTRIRSALASLQLPGTEKAVVLRNWFGAGSIAQALMTAYNVDQYYSGVASRELIEPQKWAHHAFFGGRIEMLQQGRHSGALHGYDIASAYPYISTLLPDMREDGSCWTEFKADELMTVDYSDGCSLTDYQRSDDELSRLERLLVEWSLVSMVKVRFYFGSLVRRASGDDKLCSRRFFPFYPLPFRADDGTIFFPDTGEGIYMVEEVRAMLRWCKKIYARCNEDERPCIAFVAAWRFMPMSDIKPFAFLSTLFDFRNSIVRETKRLVGEWNANGRQGAEPYDVTEKVVKLGINSCYGKTAQAVGGQTSYDEDGEAVIKPPRFANPYFAAAITAGTRAMLIDAASNDPDAIVMFATDGIISTRALPLDIPAEKTLGAWERAEHDGGIFVKAGIYTYDVEAKKPIKKNRGIKTDYLGDDDLFQMIIAAWKNGEPHLSCPYTIYKTAGSAIASKKSWYLAGTWISGERVIDIERVSVKRQQLGAGKSRARKLHKTGPSPNPCDGVSRQRIPQWVDEVAGNVTDMLQELQALSMKLGFEDDATLSEII